jgi:hypothetical protein
MRAAVYPASGEPNEIYLEKFDDFSPVHDRSWIAAATTMVAVVPVLWSITLAPMRTGGQS